MPTFEGDRARTFALDEANGGEDTPQDARHGAQERTGGITARVAANVDGEVVGRSRSMKPDTPQDARHGAQERGARAGRAMSRTDGGNATGGNGGTSGEVQGEARNGRRRGN